MEQILELGKKDHTQFLQVIVMAVRWMEREEKFTLTYISFKFSKLGSHQITNGVGGKNRF